MSAIGSEEVWLRSDTYYDYVCDWDCTANYPDAVKYVLPSQPAISDKMVKRACIAMFRIEHSGGTVSFDDWVSPSRQRWQRYENEARQILEAALEPAAPTDE